MTLLAVDLGEEGGQFDGPLTHQLRPCSLQAVHEVCIGESVAMVGARQRADGLPQQLKRRLMWPLLRIMARAMSAALVPLACHKQ